MAPRPLTTVPSTGQISWGNTTITSPTVISPSGTSVIPAVVLRWASVGMRRARAASTSPARLTARLSSAAPPESMSTTSTPARYSPNRTLVTIEMPASRSEPNVPAKSFVSRSQTRGTPPRTSITTRGSSASVRLRPGNHRSGSSGPSDTLCPPTPDQASTPHARSATMAPTAIVSFIGQGLCAVVGCVEVDDIGWLSYACGRRGRRGR